MPLCFTSRKPILFGRVARILPLVILAGLAGCGSGEDLPETTEVSGKVTLNGKLLTEGEITFYPKGDKSHPAHGQIGPDGSFPSLTTFEAGDGATIGEHIVTVQIFPKGANPGFEAQAASVQIPQKYTSPTNSDYVVEVKPGSNNLHIKLIK